MSKSHTALDLVLPDIDFSVHNSPDQSESKNTEKGLTFTGVLIFCSILLVKTYCKNNAIESHKGVISVIKIGGIATFDIKVHFCSGLMWDFLTMHRMKQTKQKSVKEIKNFHNLMQGAPWLMRFNFRGVHPAFRRLKFRVYPGSFTFWRHPKFCSSIVRMHPRFCSAFGVHPTFCSSTFRMRPGF